MDFTKINYVFITTIVTYVLVLVFGYGLVALLFSFLKKSKLMLSNLNFKKAAYVLVAIVLVYIIFFTGLTWLKYHQLLPGMYDMANMEQAIWNTLHGDLLRMTTYYPMTTRLFVHVEPLFLLLVPFFAIWQDPKMLLLIQSFLLGIGAVPVFLIAHEKLKNPAAALLLAAGYLLFPALHQGNMFDFHPLVFAPTFILFAFYFFLKNRGTLSLIFFLLALMCREEIGIMVFLFGLYIFFSSKKRWGALLALIGLSWTIFSFKFIIPAFNPIDAPRQYLLYERYGDSPLEIILHLLKHPGSLISLYGGFGKINYILFLLTPTALLALFSPFLLATALFSFATIFLSDGPALLVGKYQYSTPLVGSLILATIFGIAWLAKKIKRVDSQKVAIFCASTVALINLLLLIFHQWLPLSFHDVFMGAPPAPSIKAAHQAFKLIPPAASVVASWYLGPHVANRRHLYLIDTPYRTKADFVIVSSINYNPCAEPPSILRTCEATPEDYQKYLDELRSHPDYQLIFDRDRVLVFKRIRPAKE